MRPGAEAHARAHIGPVPPCLAFCAGSPRDRADSREGGDRRLNPFLARSRAEDVECQPNDGTALLLLPLHERGPLSTPDDNRSSTEADGKRFGFRVTTTSTASIPTWTSRVTAFSINSRARTRCLVSICGDPAAAASRPATNRHRRARTVVSVEHPLALLRDNPRLPRISPSASPIPSSLRGLPQRCCQRPSALRGRPLLSATFVRPLCAPGQPNRSQAPCDGLYGPGVRRRRRDQRRVAGSAFNAAAFRGVPFGASKSPVCLKRNNNHLRVGA